MSGQTINRMRDGGIFENLEQDSRIHGFFLQIMDVLIWIQLKDVILSDDISTCSKQ